MEWKWKTTPQWKRDTKWGENYVKHLDVGCAGELHISYLFGQVNSTI